MATALSVPEGLALAFGFGGQALFSGRFIVQWLRQRRGDAQDGLAAEEHAALGHRMKVAGEAQAARVVE